MTAHVLLVEDEVSQRELVKEFLEVEGYKVTDVGTVEDALDVLNSETIDVVFSDWKLEQRTGMELLEYTRKHLPELGFVIATAYGTIAHAVEAMKNGADDYLSKPFQRQELILAVRKAENAHALKRRNKELTGKLSEQNRLVDIVGQAPCMQKVFTRIERVSNTNATVLVNGESGTGKELAARALHSLSERSAAAFIAVNCGAIPESLAEAELFGAEKGAFTGANTTKIGKLEAADGGTLFLDEIGELPINLQPQLLRFLQEGTITRIGSAKEIKLNVRVIAATHRDLAERVKEGEFREDLFYRLNVVPITMPPLRERRDDLPQLIEHFIQQFSARYSGVATELSQECLKALLAHDWPGNVRELSNWIERYILLGEDDELLSQLSSKSVLDPEMFQIPEDGIQWEAFEKRILQQALEKFDGNRTKAAGWLGLPYKAFLYRVEKHSLA